MAIVEITGKNAVIRAGAITVTQTTPVTDGYARSTTGAHDLAATQNWKIRRDVPSIPANLDNRK